jgi:hypothetical protein
MDPVAELIDEFDLTPDLGPLEIERRGVPVKNEWGEYEPAAAVPLFLSPWTAHNVSGRDLDQVPEADRNSEIVQFYARDGSFPGAPGFKVADDSSAADIVLYKGRRFRIVTVRDFSAQGRVWCAMGALVEVQTP